MNKIKYIIRREYLNKVNGRFILKSVLYPLFLLLITASPVFLTKCNSVEQQEDRIMVIDECGIIDRSVKSIGNINVDIKTDADTMLIKDYLANRSYAAAVVILKNKSDSLMNPNIQLIFDDSPTVNFEDKINEFVKEQYLNANLRSIDKLDLYHRVDSINNTYHSEKLLLSNGEIKIYDSFLFKNFGVILGFIIYICIVLFSSQSFSSILEEKSNRVIELIITTVAPFKFMLGKITAVVLVGLTQIFIWLLFLGIFSSILQPSNLMQGTAFTDAKMASISYLNDIGYLIYSLDFNVIIPAFIFYFILGYFLYSSLFAALGASSRSQDLQRRMSIITAPLLLGIIIIFGSIGNIDGPVPVIFSIIPFTSPIVMIARIPYGVPVSELLLSGGLLILTTIATVWVASIIYKTTILLYGKKISFMEICKMTKQAIKNN